MRYYFAPLEGITDSIYRQLHHQFFPSIDQYFTPFLSPTVHRYLTPKEQRELPFADTLQYKVVPQLLTKNAEDFNWMARQCVERGYTEINLNLGCPSGTVTAKGKGAGMLQKPDNLDRFLDEIFNERTADISIKTRIGFASSAEFPALIEIFNQYPIKELTIHPRVRNAFYNGEVEMDSFLYALHNSKLPLCYNGDITSKEQIRNLPPVESVMIGRGLIADPGMLSPNGTDIYVLQNFHDALLEAYIEAFGGSRNAMFRLKEHWQYLRKRLDSPEKLEKQLRKTTDLAEYKSITAQIFAQCHFKNEEA